MIDRARIDAVMVATPDHTHAPRHHDRPGRASTVYCEKPLTHTVYEAASRRVGREAKRVTQMGTQIHAGDNYRRVVEFVRLGPSAGERGPRLVQRPTVPPTCPRGVPCRA